MLLFELSRGDDARLLGSFGLLFRVGRLSSSSSSSAERSGL
jgi:hypothetical protein